MLGFLKRSGPTSTVAAVQRALTSANLPAELDPSKLSVVELRGAYAGRKVTYFRVVDPHQTDGRVGKPGKRLSYHDLEHHSDLVLGAGYVEEDGTVMLNRVVTRSSGTHQTSAIGSSVPSRAPADRAAHPDDERFVARGSGS
jgi:hypothetical protein